ncbi:peptidoglycan DD-metalloendopeptidase family protein [Microbacterium insulae]|uniref:Peptidoglycan DD-metalloendopeptidase family protein n=1 Tax=Microbacterium insulae TaxID=483014 RepID=A0ABW3AM01_9MICO
MPHVPSNECGCAPTVGELRALRQRVTRRGVIGLSLVGLATVGLLAASPAFAATYPSWDDVERAKRNERSKADEVSRIEGLISSLAADLAHKEAEAERLGAEYIAAQEAFEVAADRADALQNQADEEAARAAEAADKLGRLAAQQYRMGGEDTTLQLFFSGSAASADDLLAKLGTMDQLFDANRSVYADAVSSRDSAQNLSNQAEVARAERDRLKREAEAKMVRAQDAASAAQAALDTQNEHRDVLEAQLAALKDTTATTISGYRAGVEAERKAREARLKREREEAERRAREQAANGGGAPAGGVQPSGWARPAYGSVSGHFGARGSICANGYCTAAGHRGTDMYAGCGAPMFAAAAGRVAFAGYSGTWGNYVKIDHGGGIMSGYAHIMPGGYNVGYGQSVRAGQTIAYAGNTGASLGCHVHFEIYQGGMRIDPVPFLRARGVYL